MSTDWILMFWRFECQGFQTGNEALRRVTVDSLDYVILFFAQPLNLAKACILRKMWKPPITSDLLSDLSGLNKSPKLMDRQHSRRNSQVTLDMTMNDFNSDQFKTRMKQMAAQVNIYLYLNAVLSPELFGAWKLAHICLIKVLLTYLIIAIANQFLAEACYSYSYIHQLVYFTLGKTAWKLSILTANVFFLNFSLFLNRSTPYMVTTANVTVDLCLKASINCDLLPTVELAVYEECQMVGCKFCSLRFLCYFSTWTSQ